MIRTEEFADPNYLRNNTDRCYFCKSELYGRLASLLGELGVDAIASGANTDDLGDHRPGMRAASENGVRHPLQECQLGKPAVRALAKAWGLPTWDKPATPCLSSRIAYGEEVTPERVKMIDAAEALAPQALGLVLSCGSAITRGTWRAIEVPDRGAGEARRPRRARGDDWPRASASPGVQVRDASTWTASGPAA